ncbi:uncharacterized protein CLUP02_14247 [Colletotrichum lupini]|uniref:Uncharacterized protein n=1 Tax=Colletotrichum lupini TaxID=145971 RepID=A0A9Q8T415_9PEZI|nr:uncharacterized protein CLUP02_14247 [Colletotrichum lupini]UQC88722.1 hypothetical protein CLUP02_14247 [Colletotrichum lupini]
MESNDSLDKRGEFLFQRQGSLGFSSSQDIPAHMYKINMMFMRRPEGDGMDSNVEFFLDVAPNQNLVTVHQGSVVLDNNYAITMERENPAHSHVNKLKD